MTKSEFEIFLLCAMFCFVVYHGFWYDMLLLFRFVRCLPFCCCCCYCCRRKNERSWMSVCCWNVWFDSLQRRLPLHRGYSTFPRSLQFILCADVQWGRAEAAFGASFCLMTLSSGFCGQYGLKNEGKRIFIGKCVSRAKFDLLASWPFVHLDFWVLVLYSWRYL